MGKETPGMAVFPGENEKRKEKVLLTCLAGLGTKFPQLGLEESKLLDELLFQTLGFLSLG